MELEQTKRQVRECGAKAAKARGNKDESLARFQEAWASRVYAMFKGDDRAALQAAFRQGYRVESGIDDSGLVAGPGRALSRVYTSGRVDAIRHADPETY